MLEGVNLWRGLGKVPTSAVCRGVSNLASQVGAVSGELQASPSTRGLLTALTYSSRWVNEVETSLRHHEQRRDRTCLPATSRVRQGVWHSAMMRHDAARHPDQYRRSGALLLDRPG